MVLSHGIDMVGINKTYDIVASILGLFDLEKLEAQSTPYSSVI